MSLAGEAARKLNHEYIGTEHQLLGLLEESHGVGANVLTRLGIDLRRVRLEVEKIVQPGPDMVTSGKLPLTPRAKKVTEFAVEEADALGHTYVGTEHLLLGMLREVEGVACQVLNNLGVSLQHAREETLDLLGCPDPKKPPELVYNLQIGLGTPTPEWCSFEALPWNVILRCATQSQKEMC